MEQNQYIKAIDSMPKIRHFPLLQATLVALILGSASGGAAQSPPEERRGDGQAEVVLWTFSAPEMPADALENLRAGLKGALSTENARHLLSEKALRAHVAGQSAPLPACLIGLDTCAPPQALAFDALGLSLLIQVDIQSTAQGWQADSRWVDRRGQVIGEARTLEATPRDLAYSLAAEIFNATATVRIHSQPEGASVDIDGDTVGTTPLSYRLALGEHRYRLHQENHQPVEGVFVLDGSTPAEISHTLEPRQATLTLVGVPEDAEILVDQVSHGAAGAPLSLGAGRYVIEVRAPGYDTFQETVELGVGQAVERRVDLQKTHMLLRDVSADAITANRYIARLSYDHSFQKTTFQNARARLGREHVSFLAFRDGEPPYELDPDLRRWIDPNGLRLDVTYSWTNFGLVLLSMSYMSTSLGLDALLTSSVANRPVPVELIHLSRLQLRPLQLRYRYIYKNLAPFAEAGTGIDIMWLRADDLTRDRPVSLSNSDAFWTLGVGAEYYFTHNIFAMLRYSAQFYIDDGPGAEHVLSIGAGIAMPNFFGIEPEPPEKL